MKEIIIELENAHVGTVHEMYNAMRTYFAANPDDYVTLKDLVENDVATAMQECRTIAANLFVECVLRKADPENLKI